MNSTYGSLDKDCYCLYEIIGPSAVTYQSRCIIQNCREHIKHQQHCINQEIYNTLVPVI